MNRDRAIFYIFLAVALAIGAYSWIQNNDQPNTRRLKLVSTQSAGPIAEMVEDSEATDSTNVSMKIESTTFSDGEMIPKKYTCDGEGINPPLQISSVPEAAKSLAFIMDDPDAPGGDFTHWVMWNIDPTTQLIEENSVPNQAIQGMNSTGKNRYMGPCPPSGTHHYHFEVYALDTTLDLAKTAWKKDLESAIKEHILQQAELVGTYNRTY